eukprot:COSAG02_NODE_1256_length_13576_cov_12.901981_1_plen_76_part_00
MVRCVYNDIPNYYSRRANVPGTETTLVWCDIGVSSMVQELNVAVAENVDYLTVVAEHMLHGNNEDVQCGRKDESG